MAPPRRPVCAAATVAVAAAAEISRSPAGQSLRGIRRAQPQVNAEDEYRTRTGVLHSPGIFPRHADLLVGTIQMGDGAHHNVKDFVVWARGSADVDINLVDARDGSYIVQWPHNPPDGGRWGDGHICNGNYVIDGRTEYCHGSSWDADLPEGMVINYCTDWCPRSKEIIFRESSASDGVHTELAPLIDMGTTVYIPASTAYNKEWVHINDCKIPMQVRVRTWFNAEINVQYWFTGQQDGFVKDSVNWDSITPAPPPPSPPPAPPPPSPPPPPAPPPPPPSPPSPPPPPPSPPPNPPPPPPSPPPPTPAPPGAPVGIVTFNGREIRGDPIMNSSMTWTYGFDDRKTKTGGTGTDYEEALDLINIPSPLLKHLGGHPVAHLYPLGSLKTVPKGSSVNINCFGEIVCDVYAYIWHQPPLSSYTNGGLPASLPNAGWTAGSCAPKFQIHGPDMDNGCTNNMVAFRKQISEGVSTTIDIWDYQDAQYLVVAVARGHVCDHNTHSTVDFCHEAPHGHTHHGNCHWNFTSGKCVDFWCPALLENGGHHQSMAPSESPTVAGKGKPSHKGTPATEVPPTPAPETGTPETLQPATLAPPTPTPATPAPNTSAPTPGPTPLPPGQTLVPDTQAPDTAAPTPEPTAYTCLGPPGSRSGVDVNTDGPTAETVDTPTPPSGGGGKGAGKDRRPAGQAKQTLLQAVQRALSGWANNEDSK